MVQPLLHYLARLGYYVPLLLTSRSAPRLHSGRGAVSTRTRTPVR